MLVYCLCIFKAGLDARSVSLRLILTCFQLAGQRFDFDLYANNSVYQIFSEIRWGVIQGPWGGHSGFMVIG